MERLAGSGQMHGGPIACLVDTAACYACMLVLGHGVPTINFRIDYLRPVIDTDLKPSPGYGAPDELSRWRM